MGRKRWAGAVAVSAVTATIGLAAPAQAAPPKSCGEIYRGLKVASMCVDYINPAPGYPVGSGYWTAMSPRIENPLNQGAEQIWAIYFNNAGQGTYLGRIDDGRRWTGVTSSVGKYTAKFEVAMADGWTRCVYLVPGGTSTTVGHC